MIATSKFLSLILRHQPEAIGLELDGNGWADVDELIAKARASGKEIDRTLIETVVATNDKKRFELSPDGSRIRASQGHSIDVDLELQPIVPPDTLYHGTATRFLTSIRATGLERRSRRHVHLSPDETTATSVGRRHGRPVVLVIDAARMHAEGHRFYHSANGVWLTESVPAEYIVNIESVS